MQVLKSLKSAVLKNTTAQNKQENAKMRVLNLGEVKVVSGGPTIQNRPS